MYEQETKASRELQIPSALDEIQNAIERLGKVAEQLTIRLDKVCMPQSPINAKDTSTPPMPASEYVENLRKKAGQLRGICELLENTMQRLEL